MKTIPWIISIIILFVILFIGYAISPKYYVKDYYKIIGFPNSTTYKTIKTVYGEPQTIIPPSDDCSLTRIVYNGIEFKLVTKCNSPQDSDSISAVVIYTPDISFGKKKIGVGSTREEIEKAYKRFEPIREPYGFIDGLTWIEFYFDENEQVNEIVFYTLGP